MSVVEEKRLPNGAEYLWGDRPAPKGTVEIGVWPRSDQLVAAGLAQTDSSEQSLANRISPEMVKGLHRDNPEHPEVVEEALSLQNLVGEKMRLGIYGITAARGVIWMIVDEMPTPSLTTEYQDMLRSAVTETMPVHFMVGEPDPTSA